MKQTDKLPPLTTLFAICVTALLAAAVLSPPVMALAAKSPEFLKLIGYRYSRITLRIAEILIIAGLFLTHKKTGIKFPSHFLSTSKKTNLKNMSSGLVLGLSSITVLCVVLFSFSFTTYAPRPESTLKIISKLTSILFGAVCVGIIEESIFRAVFYRAFRQSMNFFAACTGAALFFAFCHFFKSTPGLQENICAASGFYMLTDIAKNIFATANIPAFIGLFLTGAVLNSSYENTKSIVQPAALHTCWVIAAKLISRYTTTTNTWFPHKTLVANPVSWCILIVLFVILSKQAKQNTC